MSLNYAYAQFRDTTPNTMLSPKKSLGQNFLINTGILEKIVATAELNPDDAVLEIGPGTGNLTQLLAKKAKQVIAVEKDHRLIEGLKIKFPAIEITEGDILKLDIKELFKNSKLKIENYKVIGNIPYYITSNLLRTILEKWPKPKLIVLTVQKEVAQRIVAKPPDMNLLALSVQFYAEPKVVGYISRGSFRPMPKVDSAVIKLTPRNNEHGTMSTTTADAYRSLLTDHFFKLIKAGFSERRKQLTNNISRRLGLSKDKVTDMLKKVGLDEKIRAEVLPLEKWVELSHFL